ncbi:transposase [Hymenobacter psychrophilus]|uniref:Transposase n=1 Tax=Hymenobacter psychrophilus TaxID=651662 RepID=A0A1H3PHX9_9BACT|nr:transposase [Hymenobacter psychrophilus]SDZ00455.1 Transposase [Hymenobacter psychrophilus]
MNPKRTRRRFTAEFKAEVALAALTERQPLAELAARYQLSVPQISRWKLHLRQQAAQVFTDAVTTCAGLARRQAFVCRHRPAGDGKPATKKTLPTW